MKRVESTLKSEIEGLKLELRRFEDMVNAKFDALVAEFRAFKSRIYVLLFGQAVFIVTVLKSLDYLGI